MNTVKTLLLLPLLAILLQGCGQSDHYTHETRHLPIQLPGSEKWSILDVRTGDLVVRDAYDMMPGAVVAGMYYVMNSEGTFDYYDVSDPSRPVNNGHYGSVTAFSEQGLAVASRRGEPLQVIDRQCRVVRTLPREVVQCTMFCRGMAAYRNDRGQWGYIDERGDTVIAARYAGAHEFLHDDRAIVLNESQPGDSAATYSVIDKTGKVLFSASTAQYAPIQPYFVSGVLPAVRGDSMVCLDGSGKEVPNPNNDYSAVDSARYDDCTRTAADLFLVLKGGKMGLVDRANKVLIEPQFDRLVDLGPDRYIAINDTLCHLVDRQGKPVGDVKFTHVHGTLDNEVAVRGFIDTDMAVASMLMLFGPERCCGAGAATTLMDMNSLMDTDPTPYVGATFLNIQQRPFIIQYMFDKEVAALKDGTPTFNLDARVRGVLIALNLAHTGADTEPTIERKAQSALGTRGFILESGGVFVSEAGTAITMGYDHGIFNLHYFMSRALVQPLPHNPRK